MIPPKSYTEMKCLARKGFPLGMNFENVSQMLNKHIKYSLYADFNFRLIGADATV